MEEDTIFDFGDDTVQEPETDDFSGSIFDNTDDDSTPVSDDGESDDYSDYIDTALKAKGIDRNNIEITDEDGNTEIVSFDDLSDDDKASILSEDAPTVEQPSVEDQISDNEIEMLNYFRTNRIGSLQEFANGVAQRAVANYIANQPQAPSDIDGYTDDEIIAYDFIQRFGDNMTNEEIDDEIDRLKEDEEAYEKRVNLLRSSYKAQEEAERRLYEENEARQSAVNTQRFVQAYNQAAYNVNTIQGIDLEDQDKMEILDYVLTKDQFGKTQFSKDLDDPEKVLKMAWFMRYGEDAAAATRNYFAQLLARQRAPQQSPKSKTISRPKSNSTSRQTKQNNPFKFN